MEQMKPLTRLRGSTQDDVYNWFLENYSPGVCFTRNMFLLEEHSINFKTLVRNKLRKMIKYKVLEECMVSGVRVIRLNKPNTPKEQYYIYNPMLVAEKPPLQRNRG
jgi:hypothetical protein